MNTSREAWVVLYTTPTCPDCRALKTWLANLGVPFVEKDLSDPEVAEEAKDRTGVRGAPVTLIGGEVFYGTFASQKAAILDALGLPRAA